MRWTKMMKLWAITSIIVTLTVPRLNTCQRLYMYWLYSTEYTTSCTILGTVCTCTVLRVPVRKIPVVSTLYLQAKQQKTVLQVEGFVKLSKSKWWKIWHVFCCNLHFGAVLTFSYYTPHASNRPPIHQWWLILILAPPPISQVAKSLQMHQELIRTRKKKRWVNEIFKMLTHQS